MFNNTVDRKTTLVVEELLIFRFAFNKSYHNIIVIWIKSEYRIRSN